MQENASNPFIYQDSTHNPAFLSLLLSTELLYTSVHTYSRDTLDLPKS